MPDPNEFLEKS